MSDIKLLPCPDALVYVEASARFMWPEMEDYARQCVLADRAARAETLQPIVTAPQVSATADDAGIAFEAEMVSGVIDLPLGVRNADTPDVEAIINSIFEIARSQYQSPHLRETIAGVLVPALKCPPHSAALALFKQIRDDALEEAARNAETEGGYDLQIAYSVRELKSRADKGHSDD